MCDTRELINISLPADMDRLGLQHLLFFRDNMAKTQLQYFQSMSKTSSGDDEPPGTSTGRNPPPKQAKITGRAYVKKKLSTACPALTRP